MGNENIAVIGAGNSGLAMTAFLKHNGHRVNLWNRSESTIKSLQSEFLLCDGVLNTSCKIDLVTNDISAALANVKLVLVTTPANSHKMLATIMAPYLHDDMIVILNPGRTFGAYEFKSTLLQNGCNSLPLIAETQTIIFTCRKTSDCRVSILAIKKDVLIASIGKSEINSIMEKLPTCLNINYKPVESILETSIGNVGMILHCAPVLLNCGWIESPKVAFKYYYDGITPTIAKFLEKLDEERVEVSVSLGHRTESLIMWLKRSYGIDGDSIYECIQKVDSYKAIDAPTSLNHRYLYEDIPMGLVPLESVGKELGLKMEITSLVIDLANNLLSENFRKDGRILENLGINIKNLNINQD